MDDGTTLSTKFGDFITADHKILNVHFSKCFWNACTVSLCVQRKTNDASDTCAASVAFVRWIGTVCATVGWPRVHTRRCHENPQMVLCDQIMLFLEKAEMAGI